MTKQEMLQKIALVKKLMVELDEEIKTLAKSIDNLDNEKVIIVKHEWTEPPPATYPTYPWYYFPSKTESIPLTNPNVVWCNIDGTEPIKLNDAAQDQLLKTQEDPIYTKGQGSFLNEFNKVLNPKKEDKI
jgi:hypothetical protein